jgi:hypothetical protein
MGFYLFVGSLDGFMKKREYVEALEREMIARNNLASVKQLLQEARNEVSVLLMPYNSFLILKI